MPDWDYLIVTAANAAQAGAYQRQLRRRPLPNVGHALAVPDTEGRRIGSGGSTIQCLLEILAREGAADFEAAAAVLRRRRILILHAGGDSRRLPAYSACGKIFVPLPGPFPTLFDRLAASFLSLSSGQVVVTSGDALLLFDPSAIDFSGPGMTALAAWTTLEEASRHGVFCAGPSGAVRLYLQKPPLEEQRAAGAIAGGRALLDVGVMNFSADAAAALLDAFCECRRSGLAWRPEFHRLLLEHGLDLYREICCAMGAEATPAHYLRGARGSGSRWPEPVLAALFAGLHRIPMRVETLEQCAFLHFGSTRQLITSGLELVARDTGAPPASTILTVASAMEAPVTGCDAWVEGCRVGAPLALGGRNVLAGVDLREPLQLPPGACLDVAAGAGRDGRPVWFVRCYGVEDTFKHALDKGATFCNMPLSAWLEAAGAAPADIWDGDERTLWTARVFPAETDAQAWRRWLWMFHPARAAPEQKAAFLAADRYSAADVALLADLERFYRIRQQYS